MKRLWISLALLIGMLAATLGNAFYIQKLADSVTEQLEAAETMAKRGAWDQADTITQQSFSDWHSHHSYLHIVSRHADTDQILISFHSVLQYLALEEMDQYAAENLDLITKIQLLAEMEQPDLLNVF